MTFTIIAADQDGSVGLCSATGALAIGSRCAHVAGGVAAVTSQNHTSWRAGVRALELVASGMAPDEVLAALEREDQGFAYRQIGIVDPSGRVAVHSGVGDWFVGHIVGERFAVLGNHIRSPRVLDAVAAAFAGSAATLLEDGLIEAVEAGVRAGGDTGGQLSSCLRAADPKVARPRTDLRIDRSREPPAEGGDAAAELRPVYDAYRPLIEYYHVFWPDHPEVDAETWLRGPS